MKLKKIKVENILAVRNAEIESDKPIIFVSGNNEAGKSSIIDAVSMAFTGELCKRVSLKKEAPWLINGDDSGSIEIDHDDGSCYVNISKRGITNKGQIELSVLPYVLDSTRFSRSSADDRRKLLFEISGCKATTEEVMRRMVARGINDKLASAITPLLRAGFPEAQKEAQAKSREEKAAWRTITGEAYGDKKGETWKVKTEGNIEEIQNLINDKNNELSAIDADYETENQRFGAMKSAKDKATSRNAEIVRLRDQAEKIDRIKSKLKIDKQQVISWQARVEEAKLATSGISAEDARCVCPECNAELIFLGKNKKLIPHGDLRGNEDVAIKLPEYERSLEMCMNAVRNSERDLANAEAAKSQLALIEADSPAVDEDAITEMTAKIDGLKTIKKQINETINNLLAEEKTLREADQTTAKAYEHHRRIVEWEKIAAALAPDGIPGEILQDAIKPFNDRLKTIANLAGWKVPVIDRDMTITVNDLPYGLVSESAKWRTDCLLAEAISHISGIKLLVIDRCDVLDGRSRGEFFGLMDELASVNAFDSALVMGTLKHEQAETVAKAFENISVHWMQDGVLSDVAVKTQAEEVVE